MLWAWMMGVALSFLMSCSTKISRGPKHRFCLTGRYESHLLQGLVVDEAGSIFWNIKLALLDVFAELPAAKEQY